MEKRRLGRTDLEVALVGFGAMWLADLENANAVSLVRKAFELGMNYFDTARGYRSSEQRLGLALQDVREHCIIATKTFSKTRKESSKEIRRSLQHLKTDRIDILQLHAIDDEVTLEKATGRDGVLQTCKEARKKGLIDFIGISGHRPDVLVKAAKTEEFDTILVPLNVLTPQATEELLPVAKEHDLGVVAMKVFVFKVANIATWSYNPSLSVFADQPDLATFLGENGYSRVRNILEFMRSQEISAIIPGFRSIEQVELAVRAEEELERLKPGERSFAPLAPMGDYCRDCGLCLPCPQKLNIPAMMRFHDLGRVYKAKAWAQKLYGGLEVRAGRCNRCGVCESRCLYKVPIPARLKDFEGTFPLDA